MQTLRNSCKSGFTLIELMIVIVILGALTALILPQFDQSEQSAKKTGCNTSKYGTLRSLTQYRTMNGGYPSGMHTGLETPSAATPMGANGSLPLTGFMKANFADNSDVVALTEKEAESLEAAGIYFLSAGGFEVDSTSGKTCPSVARTRVNDTSRPFVVKANDHWFNKWKMNDDFTKQMGTLDEDARPITTYGVPLSDYRYQNVENTFTKSDTAAIDGSVIPLFIAPTTVWDKTYMDGAEGDSKIQMGAVGRDPGPGNDFFNYYVAWFKVYHDGSPAKLIGTTCPGGSPLNP